MRKLLLIMFAAVLCGCRVSKETEQWKQEYYSLIEASAQKQETIDSLTHVVNEFVLQQKSREEKDSSYHSRSESDTLIVKDSVHVKEFEDGSRETTYWHSEFHIRTVTDTVIDHKREREQSMLISELRDSIARYREAVDSLSETHHSDSLLNEKKEEVIVKETPWWKTLPTSIGIIVIIGGLVWLLKKLGVFRKIFLWI